MVIKKLGKQRCANCDKKRVVSKKLKLCRVCAANSKPAASCEECGQIKVLNSENLCRSCAYRKRTGKQYPQFYALGHNAAIAKVLKIVKNLAEIKKIIALTINQN